MLYNIAMIDVVIIKLCVLTIMDVLE